MRKETCLALLPAADVGAAIVEVKAASVRILEVHLPFDVFLRVAVARPGDDEFDDTCLERKEGGGGQGEG